MSTMRIVVVGSGGVGKSGLAIRFVQGNFVERYDPTIEANYRKQVTVEKETYMLDLLDTAGQEEYSVLREQYMRMGEGFVLVYSIVSPQSFNAVIKFHQQAVRFARTKPSFVLAGNKCDLEGERAVTAQEGKELAANLGCQFLETSAMLNKNVSELFMTLVGAMHAVRHSAGVREKRPRHCSLL